MRVLPIYICIRNSLSAGIVSSALKSVPGDCDKCDESWLSIDLPLSILL